MSLLLKNMPVAETAPTDHPPLDTGQQVFSTVFSLLLSTVGTSANAISLTFFHKQRTQSLGDQILILLNSLDLMLCVLTFVDVVCRSWLQDTVTTLFSSVFEVRHFSIPTNRSRMMNHSTLDYHVT